jgi:protein-tyrosine kinase
LAVVSNKFGASEGKTTVTANLSVALAQLDQNVPSIDGDMRRPSLHRIFSMSDHAGLADYLKGNSTWQRVVSSTVVPGLSVIVSGGRPRNPAELLSSDRMHDLIRAPQSQFDIMLVDSPTLLNMADSRILASYVSAVVLIVKSGDTPKKLAKQAFTNPRSVSARIVGVVLN